MASNGCAVREQSPSANDHMHSDTESNADSFDVEDSPILSPRPRWSKFQFVVIIAAILMSNFSTAFDASLSASTHVAVASAFNRTNVSTWPVNVFYITSMTTQPIYARVSDHIGRKIPYLVASATFLFGLVLSANAFSWVTLVIARAICGLGIAGVMAMGSIILTDAVGVGKRGYYQSVNYVTYGSGSAIGSGIGGLLVQRFGWAWVYKSQIPGAICALLLVVSMPSLKMAHIDDMAALRQPKSSDGLRNYDWLGSLWLISALLSLFITLNTGALPWSNKFAILSATSMAIFTTLFLRVEKKAKKPILPLDLLFKFPTRNILVAGFLFSVINYMIMYNTTIFFQTVHLESMQAAGTRLVLPSIVFSISSVLSGSLIAKWKTPAYTLCFSQGLLLVGTSGVVVAAGVFSQYKVPSFVYNFMLTLPAFAVGMMAPSTVLTLLNTVSHDEHAVANGSLNMVRAMGVFIATALSTAVSQNVLNICIAARNYDAATLTKIKAVRQNVELILSLEEPLRSEVVGFYTRACTTVFNLCTFGALIIIMSLANVKMEAFKKEETYEMKEAHEKEEPI
ncbi:hypothetical protein BP6252_11273 [Coleophoma cylindrospora]|uniref:Major facilitator superfamily (MFS) profile domain-containing protein n=1 Tax=Coleophoma cylindrospora TaxID=1849047 RepID=A0A3D8QPX1_9HELO|nr:hypothetical protein BP6252_11273 [Coleophoma cylindrospora]